MTIEQLKNIILGTSRILLIFGILAFSSGLFLEIAAINTSDLILMHIIAIILLIFGSIMLAISLKTRYLIKTEKEPLLSAIKNNNYSFAERIYSELANPHAKDMKSAKIMRVIIVSNENKKYVLTLPKKVSANEIITFLKTCFPYAKIGKK
jgi:hypothetical protein